MIFNKLIEIIDRVMGNRIQDKNAITNETKIISDLGMNSIILLMTAFEIEEEFGITLAESIVKQDTTVGDIVSYIEKNTK